MALRIEYLLFFVLLMLLLSIVSINPSSQAVKIAKGDKEVEFKNFSLYEIYKEENSYQLLSKEAFYESNMVYLNQGVNILRDDGLNFVTNSLKYNVETKDIKSLKNFVLKFNGTKIEGDNLALNMKNKKITADNINAKIVLEP